MATPYTNEVTCELWNEPDSAGLVRVCNKSFRTDGGLHIHQASVHKYYVHSTIGGYRRHKRLKEPVCDLCQEAKRDYENFKSAEGSYRKNYAKALRVLRNAHKAEFSAILRKLRDEHSA